MIRKRRDGGLDSAAVPAAAADHCGCLLPRPTATDAAMPPPTKYESAVRDAILDKSDLESCILWLRAGSRHNENFARGRRVSVQASIYRVVLSILM